MKTPHFAAFMAAVEARLELGAAEYGDRSFSRDLVELLAEIKEELADVCGWGAVLFARIERMELALGAVNGEASEPASNGKLLDAGEAAELLNMPKSAVYRLAREGKIKSVRIGERGYRFDRGELEKWIRAGGAA